VSGSAGIVAGQSGHEGAANFQLRRAVVARRRFDVRQREADASDAANWSRFFISAPKSTIPDLPDLPDLPDPGLTARRAAA
jgi:hypothetical protein